MSATATRPSIRHLAPNYRGVIRPAPHLCGHEAAVVDVTGSHVTFDYLAETGHTEQVVVPVDRLDQVAVDPSPMGHRHLQNICRYANCNRVRDDVNGGNGYHCYAHRRIVVGTVQLHERFVESRQNAQRDMPHLDRQTIVYEPQIVDLTISYGALVAGRVPLGHAFTLPTAVLSGEVESDINYDSAFAPIAFGGGGSMTSKVNSRAGNAASYHLSFEGRRLRELLVDHGGHMITKHAAVTVLSNGVLVPDELTMVRAGHWPHQR